MPIRFRSDTRALRRALRLLALVAAASAAPLQAQPGSPTVTTAWLADHLRDPALVLLHVGERGEYDAEHIPGARFVSLSAISVGHGRGQGLTLEVPPADSLRRALEQLGISGDSRVVVYYGEDWVTPATRVIFTLDHAGLGDRVALLDGGMPQWKREGRPVSADAPPARAGTLAALRLQPTVVDVEWVKSHLGRPGIAIVDARAPVFYSGSRHGEHRAGHVPGAVNIPFSSVFGDDLKVQPKERLQELFRAAGVQPGDTVVAYCHIGQQATAVIFAARALGHPVKLYDGSFQDWSARSELPVEGGEGTTAPRKR